MALYTDLSNGKISFDPRKTVTHKNHYDSVAKLDSEGVGTNTIILLFSDKNQKNIAHLSLKAVQWFAIGGTSPPSRLTIGWRETQLLLSHFCKWWTTALPLMTGTRCPSSFYHWIIKLLYSLHLPNQISPRNHNCNAPFTFFSQNNSRSENGQKTDRERSEHSLTVLSTGSARKLVLIE